MATTANRMVGDIGGTNTRLALFDAQTKQLCFQCNYRNRDYDSLADIIFAWLHDLSRKPPEEACLAVAAPPFDDEVRLLNIDWRFSPRELAKQFGFSRFGCINDFEGNAYALPHLNAYELVTLQAGKPVPHSRLATLGPGTGLGGATLDNRGPKPIACASEPGHMGLTPATALEFALFERLGGENGEVYAERLLSGPGLLRLYQVLARERRVDAPLQEPEAISANGLRGECLLCVETLELFCGLLGSACGDFVLANGAYGGLYLAGGILPTMTDFLRKSTFSRRFTAKGKMKQHLSDVPLYLVCGDSMGLVGAAHAPV
ncbi:MAG: glucokinase [Halioglobus sp.]|nr:glucokinase [Halioglobus sp.]